MATEVIYSVSCEYNILGVVKDVNVYSTHVADRSDINNLEFAIRSELYSNVTKFENMLEQQKASINKLTQEINSLRAENYKMREEIIKQINTVVNNLHEQNIQIFNAQ